MKDRLELPNSSSSLNYNILHEIFLEHILQYVPHGNVKKQALRAIKKRKIEDLYFLVGRTKATVPSYLKSCNKYVKAAGLSIMLPVLHSLGFKLSKSIFYTAATKGNLGCIRWLKDNCCIWDRHTFDAAAKSGNLDMMKWLRSHGCPWGEVTFWEATKNGNLEIIKWLKENGCPWDEWTFWEATKMSRRAIMQWLFENGCPWDEWTFAAAAENGCIEILAWLWKNGCPWDAWAFIYAARGNQLDCMKWLLENVLTLNEGAFENMLFQAAAENNETFL